MPAPHLAKPRVHARAGALIALLLLVAAAVAAGSLTSPAPSAAAPPPARVVTEGRAWFLTGASLPALGSCDFGCRQRGGVVGNTATVDKLLRDSSRKGVKVVRWTVFPGDAAMIRRAADGTPVDVLSSSVNPDLDRAVSLARKHDVRLQLVLFSQPAALPATWFTVPAQREALAAALAPLFARVDRSPGVLAWELFDEPELQVEAGRVPLADAQATVARLAKQVADSSDRPVTVGQRSVAHVPQWNGLGLDFHSPHWWSVDAAGAGCAGCRTAASLGADAPVVIGATDVADAAAALARLRQLRDLGYAGAYLWNLVGAAHPANPAGTATRVPLDATWRFIYSTKDAGPRARPLNPCLGPEVGSFYCPDLRMSPPANLFVGTRRGRTILYSRNSINSMGSGPAELRATREGRFTMTAVQRIWKRGGGKLTVDTDAKVVFKAIPGQYRYWKWKDAATFELYRLDGAGNPTHLVRTGPKTVYCLRDLRRTRGFLPRSPRGMYYPACSQSLSTRRVTLGTSVGWSDIYPATYHENWIDVTSLRGCFMFVHIADPTNVMYESNEDNNRGHTTVRLPFRGSNAGCPSARPLRTVSDGAY